MQNPRISSLDGLRAISIAFVLLGHFAGTMGLSSDASVILRYADFGVRVFFVISGYLITRLLLEERSQTGTISLPRFYGRRALRIFPAAYVFIAVVIVVYWRVLSPVNVITALTYTQNFSAKPQWLFGHLWSLSVEEQFYCLWPFLLKRFFSHRRTILWGTIIAVPFINCGLIYFGSPTWGRSFFSVVDVIAVGCLLAIWRSERPKELDWLLRGQHFWIFPAFAVLLAPLVLLKYSLVISVTRTLSWRPLMHFAIALSIEGSIQRKLKILNLRPVVWIGTLSYSLYLWQQLFSNTQQQPLLLAFPANLVGLLALAAASHYLIEKPFLTMRRHIARPQAQAAAVAVTSPT